MKFSSLVYSWGSGVDGQLGHGVIDYNKSILGNNYVETIPKPIDYLKNLSIVNVSAGTYHSAALSNDGKVYTWGKNVHGILGHGSNLSGSNIINNNNSSSKASSGDDEICLAPKLLQSIPSNIKQVSCGEAHTAVLTKDGELYTWGFNGSSGFLFSSLGALGIGDTIKGDVKIPTKVYVGGKDDVRLKSISSGKSHMLGLGLEGEVWVWGEGKTGIVGDGGQNDAPEPVPIGLFLEMDVTITQIACGQAFNLALSDKGDVYSWGSNDQGQLGVGSGFGTDTYSMETYPAQIKTLKNIKHIAAGTHHALAVGQKGEVYMWGYKVWMEPHLMSEVSSKNIIAAGAGDRYSIVLSDAGQLFSWGKSMFAAQNGVLAQGDKRHHAQPQLISSLANIPIKQISCGNRHVLALAGMP